MSPLGSELSAKQGQTNLGNGIEIVSSAHNLVVVERETPAILSLFVKRGVVSAGDAGRVASAARETGQSLHAILDRLGLVTQRDWADAVAEVTGLPLIALEEMPRPLPKVERLSDAFMVRKGIAPLDVAATPPAIAVADPTDPETLRVLRMTFGPQVDIRIATERDIEAARLVRTDEGPDPSASAVDDDALRDLANNAPTITYVESLLAQAVERGATDIHLETVEHGLRVRLRMDGLLLEAQPPAPGLAGGVMSRVKILAGMDISERRLPQDGRIRQRIAGRSVDMRAASLPSVTGETLVLRVLDGGEHRGSLAQLDLPPTVEDEFALALTQPNGLILVTGPTGSGKTTTLHAALGQMDHEGRKIVTIENPVEISAPGAVQVEVHPEIGLSFAAALRTVLRHDPDILMVGEIRDGETAELAIRAAMTGHLVFSTLHTNDAAEAMQRLADLGVPDYLIRSVVRMAVGQRLVRCLCSCATPLSEEEREQGLGPLLRELRTSLPVDAWAIHKANGCEACNYTGYKGRRAVFEALGPADFAKGRAPKPMAQAAIDLVSGGITSFEEVARVFGVAAFEVPE